MSDQPRGAASGGRNLNPLQQLAQLLSRGLSASNDAQALTSAAQAAAPFTVAQEGARLYQENQDSIESWTDPLDGVSKLLGSAVALENPISWGEGGFDGPTLSEALINRGVPPVVAYATEFFVPDPVGAAKLDELIPIMQVAPLLAAMVPRDILTSLAKVTRAGADDLPMTFYHGTPNPVDTAQLRASRDGAHGPGLYITERPDKAERYAYSSERQGVGLNTPSMRQGYFGTNRIMDSGDKTPFSPRDARDAVYALEGTPAHARALESMRNGTLSPNEFHSLLYTYVPIGEVKQRFLMAGWDGWYDQNFSEGALLRPNRDWIEPWNVDRMLEVIEGSGQFTPEQIADLRLQAEQFKNSKVGP